MKKWLALAIVCLASTGVQAQMRPPAFAGGIPGLAQMRAVVMQRHQARTLLYREALEELRKNPAAADLPHCTAGIAGPCLAVTPMAAPPAPPAAANNEASVAPVQVPASPAPRTDIAAPSAPATATTLAQAAEPTAKPAESPKRRRFALLVGNNEYRQPIPSLETPIADVSAIADVLRQRFGYDAKVVKNAGQADIIGALNKIAAEAEPGDSVLLFYAGHGYLMDDTNMGFWIPTDASTKTAKGWISNTDISKMLSAIRARQLILVSDSCFSGSLTKERKVEAVGDIKPDDVLARRSVLVLSSGGEEPVSDEGKEGHSIFAWNLIKTLEQTGTLTPGATVWKTVHSGVTKDFPQEPQYGAVVSAGHADGGEYLFQPQ